MNTISALVEIHMKVMQTAEAEVPFFNANSTLPLWPPGHFSHLKSLDSRAWHAKKMFPSPFAKCRKDVPNPALIS